MLLGKKCNRTYRCRCYIFIQILFPIFFILTVYLYLTFLFPSPTLYFFFPPSSLHCLPLLFIFSPPLLLLSNLLSIRLPSRLSAQTLWDLCCSLCFLIPAHLAAQPSACCQGYQTGREVGFLSVCVCVCLCVPVKKEKRGGKRWEMWH